MSLPLDLPQKGRRNPLANIGEILIGKVKAMLPYINELGNWLLSQDGGDEYRAQITKLREQWLEAETLLESAVHWSHKVGVGDKYELNEGAPPFKAAFEKIEECSQAWRDLLDHMAIPYQGDFFPSMPRKEA